MLSMANNLEASFERCCRLCAEEQDVTVMIFGEESEAMLLQTKLNKYLLIEVDEDDKLPKNVCISCCTKLQMVCDFIDTARKAQEILLNRSIMLEQIAEANALTTTIKSEPDDDARITEMEVSVDPMMVLQNSEDLLSATPNENCQSGDDGTEGTNFQSADGEYVTIKLIKRGIDASVENNITGYNKNMEATSTSRKDIKPFACVTCKRSFLTELALKNHSWIHINEDKQTFKRYRCSQCDDSYDYKSELIGHLREHRVHGLCQLCGRGFRSESNLAAHMALHMSSSKSYTCKICGRSYNTKSNLSTHSITHSNERPFKCHICKKSFKRNQDLKFHLNQHTGEKPYKCPFCDKCFASSGNCYSHRSRMHPGRRIESIRRKTAASAIVNEKQEVEKPQVKTALNKGIFRYQCNMCSHSFMRRDNYTYHMYQHTGQKPFKCTFCPERFVTRRGLLLHHDKEHRSKNRPLALLSKNVLLK